MSKLRALAIAVVIVAFLAIPMIASAHNDVICRGRAIGGGGFLLTVNQTSYLPYHGHYYHLIKVSEGTYNMHCG
jgi:hypothetical protein